jgi:prepilin-type N-terminal cleavage/methylation domain-containing protein
MKPRPTDAGFTLIEALVALTILVLSLSGFYQALIAGTRGTATVHRHERALSQALSLIERVGISLPLAAGEGQFDDGTSWRMTATAISGAGIRDGVTASWIEFVIIDRRGAQIAKLRTARQHLSHT